MSNIRLGLAGWGFRAMSIREYFDTASRLSVPQLELNCRADVPNHAWVDFDKQDVAEVQDCAVDEGIEIVALSAGNDFSQSDPGILNRETAQLRQIIELAAELGAGYLRTVLGRDKQASAAVLETAVRKLQEAGQFADSFNIKLAIENGPGILDSIRDCLRVMEQLRAGPVGLVYNPGKFARGGDDPVKALELLGEYICYAHLVDWNGQDFCAVGQGQIDWKKVLALLDKYEVELALIEYPYPEDIELGTASSYKKLSSLLRRVRARKK